MKNQRICLKVSEKCMLFISKNSWKMSIKMHVQQRDKLNLILAFPLLSIWSFLLHFYHPFSVILMLFSTIFKNLKKQFFLLRAAPSLGHQFSCVWCRFLILLKFLRCQMGFFPHWYKNETSWTFFWRKCPMGYCRLIQVPASVNRGKTDFEQEI